MEAVKNALDNLWRTLLSVAFSTRSHMWKWPSRNSVNRLAGSVNRTMQSRVAFNERSADGMCIAR